ncbi:heavy metal translocating P-type ATPase [Ethanoligenens harbinense]|jgi:Cd2+/Zn2+-exporting ATPase|uniref:heavy metal translocating P-type ATPase n=1 Tax=Ethanoligenens harbinense TaxID=253239 RepID=UPI000EA3368C|nr:heavy metal translocating P-type ATPase [Ethanoligenens harbinense]AYF41822.1 cadmium-translocating P-type ATPase [Ethanoligenens harbinense]
MLNKELILQGLDCANCAAKIEREVNELNGVKASMNFMNKTLTLEIEADADYGNVLEQVKSIVSKHEPDVSVKEKSVSKGSKKVLILEGLDCANCAAKIEAEVQKLEEVELASVDFVSKKLILETSPGISISELSGKIESIIKKIEPDVRVTFGESATKAKTNDNDADDNNDDEGEENHKKEIIKLVIGAVIFAVGMVGRIFNFPNGLDFTIFIVSYIILGGSVVLRAIKGIVKGQVFSEHFLMSVATIGAFFVGEYPEGVAVMLFYLLGELFEDMAVDNSRKSISSLMDIRPDYANLKVGEDLKKVSPEDVSIGDIIVIKPGEKVPLDGKVIDGASMVDTSALTGESVPRELKPGKDALSGFVNKNGVLTVEVTKDYGESTVTKILDLVQNASGKKAPTEKFITKFARWYTPIVVFGALALAIIPPLVIPGAAFSTWIYRALVFLVVSCPCALVISIPLGFIGGIGGASKKGILVKGGNYLEALNHVEAVVFDKTGTLTKGVFKVTEVNSQNDYSNEKLIEYAAYAESYSNHPIALSIISDYNAKIDKSKVENYQEIAGQGIKVNVNGKEVLAGNSRLMVSENINYSDADILGTVVHIAIDRKYAGNIVISDEVKEDSARAIRELKSLGVRKTVMLTGDLRTVGDRIGKQLGLDEVYSELLPAGKVEKLELLDSKKSPKGKLVFVGDGINDAPVLARADIGIAMGGLGSDAAIEAADVVIMTDEPSKIASALKIARRTSRIVYQNIVFALGVKAIFLVLGALGLASMWAAVFADMGVAIIAILNAMRALNTKEL